MILNYRKLGEGSPLFILHGVFGSADNWHTLGRQFAEKNEVFLVDQRNHGGSFHDDAFNYDVMAEDLRKLLDHEKINKIDLMGHSMGGKTAMKFACRYPDLIRKLIVVDIAPRIYPPHHQQIFKAFESVNLETLKSRGDADQQMSSVISDAGVKLFLLKNLKRTNEGFQWKVNLEVIKKNIEEVGKGLLPSDHFDGDTLFIGGGASDYLQVSDHALIHSHFPKANIEMIAGAGHWVHAVKPKELYDLVDTFLES
ncbi:MAG: alpha/beta fold hydrolase [Bacteroidota bacterium]